MTPQGQVAGRHDGAIRPGPSPCRHAASVSSRALCAILALGVLVLADTGAVQATRAGLRLIDPDRPAPNRTSVAQWDAVRRELAARLRPGTRVVEGTSPTGWHQRLIEDAVLAGLTLVDDPAQAQYRISVVDTRSSGAAGVRLVITAAGRP